MPAWSVPSGLIVPGPREPDADAAPDSGPSASETAADDTPASETPASETPASAAAAADDSWPGVAPPAEWFLRASRPRPPVPPEDAPAPAATAASKPPAPAAPESQAPAASESQAPAAPESQASTPPAVPASPWPSAAAWPNARPVPSPVREPDGSWSSPLTPKPATRPLGPTPARYGRAGGPGFQPARPGQPGPRDPALSPWQRSHQLWTEAGIEWEQPAPPPRVAHPRSPAPPPVPRPRAAAARQAPPLRPPPSPRHAPGRHTRPGPQERPTPEDRPAPQDRPSSHGAPEPAAAGWPGHLQAPLGAPVFSGPGVDEDGDPLREDRWDDDSWGDDRWDDDQPPIRERPPGLFAPPGPRRPPADEALLHDHRAPGPRRSGSGRRTARIVVPVVVVVAVAVLALALLTGHGPKFGPLGSDPHKAPRTVAPRLPLAAVTFDTYPGQQQRGVFQTVNRVVAVGNTIVTTGSQAIDGVVRQQFLVSTDGGASWHVAPVHAPGGGQAAFGHPATLLAGGPGGWVAVGSQAIWTSPNGLSWTLTATHGVSPKLPGDSVWVITKTPGGFLAAGTGTAAGSAARKATQAVIWTSRDGVTWRRGTAAQLGLAAPGESVLNISYATYRGTAIVISGDAVSKTGVSYDGAWLSTSNGATWTRVTIPADHGAGPAISGLASDGSGLIAIRPGRTVAGTPDGVAYFSPDGHDWQYAATIDPTGGWTPGVVKGSDYGFVVTGTTASGQLVAYTSTGTGTAWLPTGSLGTAPAQSVSGATVARAGTIVAIGSTALSRVGQQPVFLEASTDGTVRAVLVSGIAGAAIPEMKINSTAVAGGVQIAVGSANGYPAVWRRAAGDTWTLVSSLALVAADPHLRALTSVTHGPAGWLAVGAPGPVVLTSADGAIWGLAGGNITQDLAGVSAVAAAAGPAGYVIVGKLVAAGGNCVADVWWSRNLTSWTRAHDVNLATGSSQVLSVAATADGFVSVGSHNGQPAAWTTTDGKSWRTIVMPPPGKGDGEVGGSSAAALQQVAVSGNRVVALGQASTGTGPAVGSATGTQPGAVPFAELSTDGGVSWQQVPFSSPGPYTSFTALTASAAGFTAAGVFGPPGQQDVAVWTSGNGASWKPARSSDLNGSDGWRIDALASSGSAVTGIGTIVTQQSQQTVTFTLPTR
jgi:hypothetical protein